VKPMDKQFEKRAAFTIVELLTVMSIIVILIGLLVPALSSVKRFAKRVKQQAQFYSIGAALELFGNEEEGYPDTGARDEANEEYCGALKLCEAMVGQDLLGFHPSSHFRSDLTIDGTAATLLYDYDPDSQADDPNEENLRSRKGPYLPLENANAYRLWHLYGQGQTVDFREDLFVLCDVYSRVTNRVTGKKVGMPILYYKANTSGIRHDPDYLPMPGDSEGNIYNYLDNDELVKLGMPWAPGLTHPICSTGGTTSTGDTADPRIFYEKTKNYDIAIEVGRPYRSDSYILLSAGFDGEYGTADDIFNFGD